MNKKLLFSATLRIRHPRLTARKIIDLVGMEPRVVQSIGELRISTLGKRAEEVYQHSYVTFPFDVAWIDYPDDFLKKGIERPCFSRLARITTTGGTAELFFGLHCTASNGFELELPLIEALANKGIAVAFDIYGGEWK